MTGLNDKFIRGNEIAEAYEGLEEYEDVKGAEEAMLRDEEQQRLDRNLPFVTMAHCDDFIIKPNDENAEKTVKKFNDGNRIKCQQCRKTFATRSSLKRHQRLHMNGNGRRKPQNPFACDELDCASSFPNRMRLLKHKSFVHENVRKHACEHCGKRFHNSGGGHTLGIRTYGFQQW
jgi:hypothetical protein